MKTWDFCKKIDLASMDYDEDMVSMLMDLNDIDQIGCAEPLKVFLMKIFFMNIRGLGSRVKK